MKILPEPPNVNPQAPFENDLFGNERLAEGLTNLISEVEQPLVIALDGDWGSGKTTFLKQWKHSLEHRENSFPVIYFDAFENDYVEDAFAALAREVVILIEDKDKKSQLATFRKKAVACGSLLLKSGARLAIKAGIRAASAGTLEQFSV
ncbi:MAG: P-loop NTPase fold protein [Aestuariivirga sp.]|uniref:P-loop NTPase fold protein n=1 Tax=Aestuariivirga sp. TaxID=2650926 RepID=UPI0038D0391C